MKFMRLEEAAGRLKKSCPMKSGNQFASFKMAAVSLLLGRTSRYFSPTVRAFCSKVSTSKRI